MPGVKKAVIYARVSREQQHTGNQTEVLIKWAEERGYQVARVYEEEESAWRAGHQQQLARADQETLRAEFGEKLGNDNFVFARPDGRPLGPNAVTCTFAKVIRKAGLPRIRLHDLRHTHATLMLKAGIHPKVVSERLGHANIGITLDTCSHVLPGLQEAAAEHFDRLLEERPSEVKGDEDVCKMFANTEDLTGEPNITFPHSMTASPSPLACDLLDRRGSKTAWALVVSIASLNWLPC